MTPDERQQHLNEIGSKIRLSELPDDVVLEHVVIEILHGIGEHGIYVNSGELAAMLTAALVKLGGYHRSGSCAW